MKKIILRICFTNILLYVFTVSLFSQQNNDCVRNVDIKEWTRELINAQENISFRNTFVQKIVRINFHFMLKSDGSGNFNEHDDGLGNPKSGYDIAYDLMERMNNDLSWNRPTLNDQNAIPNLPAVEDRKYYYVLDAVFFHENSSYYSYYSAYNGAFGLYGDNKTEVINIFFTEQAGSSKIRGVVYNISANTNNKFVDIANLYDRYQIYLNNQEPYSWFLHAAANTIMHEIGHLKGLKHTVYVDGSATPCPFPLNPNCDDNISDTPTAYEVFNNSNCGIHPAAGWGNSHPCCSKNLMDYEGGHALTPLQIANFHIWLEGGMRSYNMCAEVEHNKIIDFLGFPKLSYYGQEVGIQSKTLGGSVSLVGNQPADIYFSEGIEFFPMEVEGTTGYRTKMEVFQYNTCDGF